MSIASARPETVHQAKAVVVEVAVVAKAAKVVTEIQTIVLPVTTDVIGKQRQAYVT